MTDKRMTEILRGITVIIDTRENENRHITQYFNANGINYVERKLDYGDYSFICPAIPEIGYNEPISQEKCFVVERKHSLDELSGNIAQERKRFEREFERCQTDKAKMILLVENGNWQDIIEHKYRTGLNEKSYMASLFSFSHKYNIQVQFIPAKYAGMFIFSQFYYFLRNELKQLEANVC
jgi:ERCC4-type nuclease